jgi:hypothetical protein
MQIAFIDTYFSIYFMSKSKCGSYLLIVIYNIQANHDAMESSLSDTDN